MHETVPALFKDARLRLFEGSLVTILKAAGNRAHEAKLLEATQENGQARHLSLGVLEQLAREFGPGRIWLLGRMIASQHKRRATRFGWDSGAATYPAVDQTRFARRADKYCFGSEPDVAKAR